MDKRKFELVIRKNGAYEVWIVNTACGWSFEKKIQYSPWFHNQFTVHRWINW